MKEEDKVAMILVMFDIAVVIAIFIIASIDIDEFINFLDKLI